MARPTAAMYFMFVLTEGRDGHATVTLANPEGHLDLTFEVGEVNLGGGPAAASTGGRNLPALADPNARTTKGSGRTAVAVPPSISAVGDVLASWPTVGLDIPWGVGFDGTVWLSDPPDMKNTSSPPPASHQAFPNPTRRVGRRHGLRRRARPDLAGQRRRRQWHLRDRPGRRLGRADHHRCPWSRNQPARPGLRPGRRRVLHRRLERGHRLPRGRARRTRRRARR